MNFFSGVSHKLSAASLLILSTLLVGCASAPRDVASAINEDVETENSVTVPTAYRGPSEKIIPGDSFVGALSASAELKGSPSTLKPDPALQNRAYICHRYAHGQWSKKKQRCTVGEEVARIQVR